MQRKELNSNWNEGKAKPLVALSRRLGAAPSMLVPSVPQCSLCVPAWGVPLLNSSSGRLARWLSTWR